MGEVAVGGRCNWEKMRKAQTQQGNGKAVRLLFALPISRIQCQDFRATVTPSIHSGLTSNSESPSK